MTYPTAFPLAVAIVAVAIAATTDLRQFRIPNWLTLPLLPLGLLYHAAAGGTAEFMASGLGALLGFLLLFPLYVTGGMGAGDVKLMAGLGAWLKTAATLETLVISCLVAGVYALALMRRANGKSVCQTEPVSVNEACVGVANRRLRLIPFGAMIAAGLLLSLARHWL